MLNFKIFEKRSVRVRGFWVLGVKILGYGFWPVALM